MRTQWMAIGLAAAVLTLGGCAEEPEEESTGDPAVASIEAVTGSDVSTVTLTELGAKRLGVATVPVQAGPGGLVIPFTAVVYGADGSTWTFTNPSGTSYVRAEITIARIDGGNAILSSGPPVGTAVVTVGIAELAGAEAELGY
jgi:hypothetical protein